MDKNSIIDKETFEVCTNAEDHLKVFVCDKLIALVIATLNKKGYKTFASCSGHYKIEYYEYLDEPIDKLKDYQKNNRIIIKEVRDNTFDYWIEVDSTTTYILFSSRYDFKSIPNDFYIENSDRTYIGSKTIFYDENGKHLKLADVSKKLSDKCRDLQKWAENLPNINNDSFS